MNKIACYRPWTSLYIENSTNATKPCCWVHDHLGYIDNDATLKSTFQTEKWEKMRKDMYDANGELPKQCPVYCQHKQNEDFFEKTYQSRVYASQMLNMPWSTAPFELSATVANACNLKCKMCWIFDDFDYEIPQEGLNRILDEIKAETLHNQAFGLPQLSINLSGGEVFYAKPMRDSLYKLINDKAAGNTFKFNFVTNASIWDQTFWDLLAAKPNALNCVTISIDGYDSESYLKIRGVDKFETVLSNIDKIIAFRNEHVKENDFWPIHINSLIQTTTYPKLKEIIDLFLEKDVVLSFIPLVVSYKSEAEWQCFNLPEHQQPCLDAIDQAIEYVKTFENLKDDWKLGWNLWSIKTSLERNRTYLSSLMQK